MMKYIRCILLSGISLISCQPKEFDFEQIFGNSTEEFQKTISNPDHEVQIIYGEVTESGIDHYVYGDTSQYFYPASTVKMLAAFCALGALTSLEMPVSSEIAIDSSEHHPRRLKYDSLFQSQMTVGNLIKKIFVYSDNQAYNVLYGWLGKEYINEFFAEVGLQTRVIHQLSEMAFSFSQESNATTTQTVLKSPGNYIEMYPKSIQWHSTLNVVNQLKGTGFIKDHQLINEPFDFTEKNYVPLYSLLGALERIVYPKLLDNQFQISENLARELRRIMLLRPEDLPSPIDTLGDNYVKFLMYGDKDEKEIPDQIQIMNKVGWAYGYLTDVAYIHDTRNDIEFFLAATVHVNENEIYNDGEYEYEEIGLPFLGELGRLIYDWELSRK